jgi:hypothetical protein
MSPPHRPGIQWFRGLGVLTGLGMTAGFGAITLHTAREYRAFPAAPRLITAAEATASAQAARGFRGRHVEVLLPIEDVTRVVVNGIQSGTSRLGLQAPPRRASAPR